MIQIKDNKVQAELLSGNGILSERIIKNYDYILFFQLNLHKDSTIFITFCKRRKNQLQSTEKYGRI